MGMRVDLLDGRAVNASPPPCGVGVGEWATFVQQPPDAPPQPSPTRGEGEEAAQPRLNSTPMGVRGPLVGALCTAALVVVVAMPACAQGALPPGEGRDLMATACSQCHPLNVIRSMREGAEGWKRHVYNMVTRGAQLNAREADVVVTYLAANFGPAATAGASAAKVTLPGGPGKDLVEARCTACHDLERVALVKRQKADWPALVTNMVGRGAVATPEEAQDIASYLASHFGDE